MVFLLFLRGLLFSFLSFKGSLGMRTQSSDMVLCNWFLSCCGSTWPYVTLTTSANVMISVWMVCKPSWSGVQSHWEPPCWSHQQSIPRFPFSLTWPGTLRIALGGAFPSSGPPAPGHQANGSAGVFFHVRQEAAKSALGGSHSHVCSKHTTPVPSHPAGMS